MAEGPGQRAHRRVGTMIRDKYRIDAFIATGSMANVYAATHRNGSRVALKILHRDLARNPSMAERFRREGYFANAIGHPGVVRAIDDDETEDGCVFIVMELLEGETLEARRKRMGGRIPLHDALQITDAILDTLSAAHDHEILHRDLKPDNVFITTKNQVKLLDFGVARFNDGRSSSDMTGVGMVLGTPAFMPPEQALGRRAEVDARSDIWSVGATLFMVVTGEAVHAGGDAKTKLIATARTPARPLQDVMPSIPRAVASVIDRALAFDKVQRWADAKAMREALRWARMSLDDAMAESDRPTMETVPPTQPNVDERPTLTGASGSTFEESTERRPIPAGIARPTKSIDGVYTSAPPVTQRDPPPSPAPSLIPSSLGPFSRAPSSLGPSSLAPSRPPSLAPPSLPPSLAPSDDRPTFSLPPPPAPETEPPTERLAQAAAPPAEQPNPLGRLRSTPPPAGAGEPLLRIPYEAEAGPTANTRVERRAPPAPGYPPASPAAAFTGALSPGPPPALREPPRWPAAPRQAAPAPGESMASFPGVAGSVHNKPLAPSVPPVAATLAVPAFSSPPPPVRPPDFGATQGPGPLLSTIAPRNLGGMLRVLIPVAIGVLAGLATYVLVVHQRPASASDATAASAAASAPLVPDASAPVPAAPSGAAPPPAASVPTVEASATPPPASAKAPPPAVSSPRPKTRRTRGRPPPQQVATDAPATEPALEPTPTSVDAVPRTPDD